MKVLRAVAAGLGVLTVGVFATVLTTTSGCASFGALPEGDRLVKLQASPRWQEDHLENEEATTMMTDSGKSGRVWREFIFGTDAMTAPPCELALINPAATLRTPPASGLRVTWLGHSTTLIEIDGVRVLSDPMWSERASPYTLVGPRRFHPPPLPFDQLPSIDAVIVSHDHYDHLDMNTVKKLAARGVRFHVGLGVGAHLEEWGVPAEQIAEHQWWEERELPGGVKVISTPARHFSGRGLTRRNRALWSSWAVVGPKHRVYFSGDTGQTAAFKTIGEKLGPFDLSMLEVGQWNEAWGQIHLGPRGALTAHQALGAKRFMPIHWSTFELGLHDWSEPAETVFTEGPKLGVSVLTPRLGEPIEPSTGASGEPWWRQYPPTASSCPGAPSHARRPIEEWPI
jgi:L-ascorbate metabolism protein UlaG (beta-lactamase superfamily)